MVILENLDGAKVIRHALVSGNIRPTGATHHVGGGDAFGLPQLSSFARYEDEDGVYSSKSTLSSAARSGANWSLATRQS